jgi:hypothetical protein
MRSFSLPPASAYNDTNNFVQNKGNLSLVGQFSNVTPKGQKMNVPPSSFANHIGAPLNGKENRDKNRDKRPKSRAEKPPINLFTVP